VFALGVARSHLVALLKRPDAWIDRRTARSRSDDTPLLEDVRQVIHGLGTYGYRRVWGVLRHQHPRPNGQAANHKRVYRVMRDHRLLLYRRYPQA
jgi:putative transposase